MDLKFIDRVILISFSLAITLLVYFGYLYGLNYGLGIFAGACWGCLNLLFIRHLVVSLLTHGNKNYLKIYTAIGIKFPLLYFLGYVLLKIDYLPTVYLVFGFTLIFIVIFLKGLGRTVLDTIK